MPYTCKICEDDPSSHSLKNIGTINNITYYYTCPAKATKYNDVVGITQHYDGVLSENTNKWIWVFDCSKFTTKHLLEINVGIDITLYSSALSNAVSTSICSYSTLGFSATYCSIIGLIFSQGLHQIAVKCNNFVIPLLYRYKVIFSCCPLAIAAHISNAFCVLRDLFRPLERHKSAVARQS